jgi:hypothetical protein
MPWSFALDIVMTGLLAATIAVALILNRRLGEMRRRQTDLEALTQTFFEATRRAEDGIGRLKISSANLQDDVERANAVIEDLRFLIERADSAADRVESGVRATRARQQATPASARTTRASPAARSEAEKNLLQALGMNEFATSS